MEDKQFSLEIMKKYQIFFAHMEQYCQQFLKGQYVVEIHNDKSEKKKERDPNAPKRPLTPFFLFSQKYREKVLERNPEVKLTQISQMAGQKWNSMTEEEKQPYSDQYNQAKSKYEVDIKEYNEKQGIITNDKKKKKSEKFDDKSIKSGQDYLFDDINDINDIDDINSQSIQPAVKHQQQLKQQQQKVIQNINSNDDNDDDDDDDDDNEDKIQQTKITQQQKMKSTKNKKKQDMDDDLQREIIQVINNDKSQKKQTKK